MWLSVFRRDVLYNNKFMIRIKKVCSKKEVISKFRRSKKLCKEGKGSIFQCLQCISLVKIMLQQDDEQKGGVCV